MANLKESLELLDGVEVLLVMAKKVAADGKVNLMDLPLLMDVLTKATVLVAAYKNVDGVVDEVKDLSFEEAKVLLARFEQMVKALKAV